MAVAIAIVQSVFIAKRLLWCRQVDVLLRLIKFKFKALKSPDHSQAERETIDKLIENLSKSVTPRAR